MSWSDRRGTRLGAVAAAILIGASLAGCTFAPVYGTSPATGRSVTAELAAIAIETPSGRVEQVVRNALLFSFTGGGPAVSPRYNLRLSVSTSETLVGVTRIAVAPSYSVDVAVSYEFSDLRTRTVITRGVARGVASYDRSNQGFANERAKREAEDRAAASAADEIRLRIAADVARPR